MNNIYVVKSLKFLAPSCKGTTLLFQSSSAIKRPMLKLASFATSPGSNLTRKAEAVCDKKRKFYILLIENIIA